MAGRGFDGCSGLSAGAAPVPDTPLVPGCDSLRISPVPCATRWLWPPSSKGLSAPASGAPASGVQWIVGVVWGFPGCHNGGRWADPTSIATFDALRCSPQQTQCNTAAKLRRLNKAFPCPTATQ